jgi:hypothetical protein
MAATLHRLQTRKDRLNTAQAEAVRQAVLALPGIPDAAKSPLLAAVDRQTAAANGWTFVMLSPADNARVVNHLVATSSRPLVAVRLWALCFEHLRRDTGEITLSREELAIMVGTTVQDVSRIMGELEAFGAITKERSKVAGMRGPGVVRYRMNQWIATHLQGAARDKAQAAAPRLALLDGGKA